MRVPLLALVLSALALMACNKPSQSSDAPSASNSTQKAAANNPASGPKAHTACDLLTPAEIAGFLKDAVLQTPAEHPLRAEVQESSPPPM